MTNGVGHDTNRRESAIGRVYVSKEIYFDMTKLENEFNRADIEIVGVDHSSSSYEGRIFLNNPNANQSTDITLENGYVGSYHIFGHGGCFGGMGHCDIPTEPRRNSDYRSSHHLRPQYKRIIITDAFRKLGKNTNKFTITIVPVLYGELQSPQSQTKEMIKFDRVGIVTYD
jgi:hypothetical protein